MLSPTEKAEGLDFDAVKGVRKPRTFSSRKPRIGSHAFVCDYDRDPLSPTTSPPSEIGEAHNGSSCRSLSKLCSDENEYDCSERSKKSGEFNVGRGKHKSSTNFKGNDNWVLEPDGSIKSTWNFGAGEYDSMECDSDQDGRNKSSVELKSWGGKIISDDSFGGGSYNRRALDDYATSGKLERDNGKFEETIKQMLDANDFDSCRGVGDDGDSHDRYSSYEKLVQDRNDEYGSNQKMGNLNFYGQGRLGCNTRCSEGVLAPAKTSGSDRRSLDCHGGGHSKGGSEREFHRVMEKRPIERGKRFDRMNRESTEVLSGSQNKAISHDADSKLVNRMDDPSSQENRPTKVKLKVGGVTHTIHANHTVNSNGMKPRVADGLAPSKVLRHSSDVKRRQKLILQENTDDEYDYPQGMGKNSVEMPKKDTGNNPTLIKSRNEKHPIKEDLRSKNSDGSSSQKRTEKAADVASCQPVRKSSRVPKRRVLDGEHEDDNEVDVYRKNQRSKKKAADNTYGEGYEEEVPQRRSSRVPKKRVLEVEYDEEDWDYCADQPKTHIKKRVTLEKVVDDLYQEDEEDAASADEDIGIPDEELDMKKKRKHELVGSLVDKEIPLTARQRALQSGKEGDREAGLNLVEFPDGLPPTGQRKQKEKLTDLEQQLKKAEAAQRRRMQVEKAAKEIQAEAIRKILGHDSNREKRRYKLRKKQDDMAQKAAASMVLGSNTVRWVMGPTGTVVSFSEDAGFPSIFNSTTCRYPPPREKCAGPSCTNTYKYRDSKSKLPLCSLQCYRAVNERVQPVTTC